MTSASQTTITGLSSMATRHILADLARDYELLHKVRVEIRPLGGVEAAKLVRAGERTDIVVLASKIMQSLEAEGHIAPSSIVNFARSEIGIAVPAGAPQPAVESEQAVRQAVLGAKRVCYSTGPSGDHLKALCEKWGMAEIRAGPRPGRPAGRASGESGLARRGRSRLPAAERVDRPTRRRGRWAASP